MKMRRVVVALDSSPSSLGALETALDLLKRELAAEGDLGAVELLGLFVEDINLLRWAALPFTGQVGAYSAALREISEVDLARQLGHQAAKVERAFTEAARARGIPASFRRTRGVVSGEILAALAGADLLLLGKVGWNPTRLGSTARALLTQGRGRILLWSGTARRLGPVAVLYDGSPIAAAALAMARALTPASGAPLAVVHLGQDGEAALALAERVREELRDDGPEARHLTLTPDRLSALPDLLVRQGVHFLVLPASLVTVSPEALGHLATVFPGPVLVVGEAEGAPSLPPHEQAGQEAGR